MNGKQTAEYINQRDEMVKELRAENAKLREQRDRLVEVATDLANDVEAEVESRKSWDLQRRIDRDMVSVIEFRAILAEIEGEKQSPRKNC